MLNSQTGSIGQKPVCLFTNLFKGTTMPGDHPLCDWVEVTTEMSC